MADLGDIGWTIPVGQPSIHSASAFHSAVEGSVATITGGVAGATAVLMTSFGTPFERKPFDASGEVEFFDLADGIYIVYGANTGAAWVVTVVAHVPSVSRISSSGITGFASFG